MSLLWTLRKFVDSVEHREAEATRRRACDGACRQRHGDGGEDGEASAAAETEPLRRCRVCGHRSRAAYCPECLADTMVPDGDSGKP
ncbi:MAG: hypothetical protein IT371_19735 [Deltaproteobacteria bacterium]|nr:hypothetical protein [Deltaproteobacteria bacterium]